MAEERYDIVVFGATGFTGQFVVEEVARRADEETGLKWAVAGRNMEKIQKVLATASQKTGKDLETTAILIADTSSDNSLLEMCKQAKVVLNCVGPYRFHGEKLVRAAIEGGANHIDISGEPQYLENMQLKYHSKAKESGVYVVGSCGFDSIPADMGVVYVTNKFEGTVNSIECYIDILTGPEGLALNTGTLESAIYGLLHQGELKTLRKSLYTEPLPPYKYRHKSSRNSVAGVFTLFVCLSTSIVTKYRHKALQEPSLKMDMVHYSISTLSNNQGACFKSDITNKYCFEFQGSDKSVVYRTQRYKRDVRSERPVQFIPYFCREGILTVIGMIFFGFLFFIMTKFSFGRSLLMKYPSLFTCGMFKKNGPSKTQMENTSFSMTFVAKGWGSKLEDPLTEPDTPPDTIKMMKVRGPEPGYVATPICMVQAAMVMLKEKSKLPKDGGVYTPAAAFMDTSLIQRLNDNNVLFQEVQD